MKYHLALGRPLDLTAIAQNAQAGHCPRHVMGALSLALGATVHQPGKNPVSLMDKLRAKVSSSPAQWALARHLATKLTSDDLIFCTGEDVGIPIAALCGAKRDRPKIAVFIHNLDRPRGYIATQLFQLAQRIDLFVTNARPQVDFLRQKLHLPESQVYLLPEQTDTHFFTPGARTPGQTRPTIVSVGLEKRDYRTLAAATQDLDADVKISGFSQDARVLAQAFPETLPANMTRQFYEWPDLVQLYRDADVVVVSLVENKFCAGLTTMMEAMACQRPVVVTQTEGLMTYLTPQIATVINPGDVAAMQNAITQLLSHPQEAAAQAQRGYEQVVQHHNSEDYVEKLVDRLASLSDISTPLVTS